MQLVKDWRYAWKWFSIHCIVAAGAVQAAVMSFPATLQQYLPDWILHYVALGLLGAAVAGRMIDQPPKDKK